MKKQLITRAAFFFLLLPSTCLPTPTTELEKQLASPSLTLEGAKTIEHEANNMLNQLNISKNERQTFNTIYLLAKQKIAALTSAIDPLALAKAEALGRAKEAAEKAAKEAAAADKYLTSLANTQGVSGADAPLVLSTGMPSDPDKEIHHDAIRQALVVHSKTPFPSEHAVKAFIADWTNNLYIKLNAIYSKASTASSLASSAPAPLPKNPKDKLKKAGQHVARLVKKNKQKKNDLKLARSKEDAAQANVAQLTAELSIKENDLRDAEAELTKQKAQLADANQRNKSLADSLKALQPQLSAAQRTATAVTAERDAALARIARAEEKARLATAALTAPQAAIQHAELDLSTKTRELQVALAQLDQAQLGITNAQQAADRETARATALERELATAQRTISDNETAYAKALDEASRLTSDAQSRTITPARSDSPTSPPPSSPISIGGDGSPRAATPETTAEPEIFGMTQKDILIALQQYIISGQKFVGSESKNNIIDIGTNRKVLGSNTSNLAANMPVIRRIVFGLATRTDTNIATDAPKIDRGLTLTQEQLHKQYMQSKAIKGHGAVAVPKNTVTLEELAGALFLNLQKATKGTLPATQTSTSGLEGIELPTLQVRR